MELAYDPLGAVMPLSSPVSHEGTAPLTPITLQVLTESPNFPGPRTERAELEGEVDKAPHNTVGSETRFPRRIHGAGWEGDIVGARAAPEVQKGTGIYWKWKLGKKPCL